MAKRSITDEEISFIKALLKRDLKNNEIQFYFNRQDRPVNSGRITGIRDGSYGGDVASATEAELDAFLVSFKASEVGVQIDSTADTGPPTLAQQARSHFEADLDGWKVVCGEGTDCESKREFDLKEAIHLIRTVAAMANNRGGFLFFGVENDSQEVVGLVNDAFQKSDIADVTAVIRNFIAPTPDIKKFVLELGPHIVGVIRVERYDPPPVVIVKQIEKIPLGEILFRYPGRSEKIRPPELFDLLRRRDRGSASALIATAQQIAEIGPERAVILDASVNKFDADQRTILIDSKLARQLNFIKEGSFDEKYGAPTLRLVGEVSPVETVKGETEFVVQEKALEPDMVVLAYLRNEQTGAPLEYIKESAMVQREWLPLFHFANTLRNGVEEALAALETTKANYKVSKKKALERLRGERSAFQKPSARAKATLATIRSGNFDGKVSEENAADVAVAIQALPSSFTEIEQLKLALISILSKVGDDTGLRGNVYRAACRLDELQYSVKPKS
jgi:hypothetical protein